MDVDLRQQEPLKTNCVHHDMLAALGEDVATLEKIKRILGDFATEMASGTENT